MKSLRCWYKKAIPATYTKPTASITNNGGQAAGAVAKLEQGQVTTNKNDIAQLRTDVNEIKATTYVVITEEEIKALFA